jgi:plastocyanin domain-containing protein
MSDTITIDRTSMWKYLALILIIGIIVVFFARSGAPSQSPEDGPAADAQKITLSYKNYNYYPNTIRVKSGVPVSITLDKSVIGCYRSFAIPDFGIDEYSSGPSDTIDFTPEKKGTFKFRCGMGMGNGILIVE